MANPDFDWERLFELRVIPLVHAMLSKGPDKIVIVVDRERRPDCCPDLARRGLTVIMQNCGHCIGNCQVAIVISDLNFESILFADYETVDRLPILKTENISLNFPTSTDRQSVISWIGHHLKPGESYQKIRDGMFLAQHLQLDKVEIQARSRSLRKLIREL